jgi:hypothetical protein
VRKVDDAVMYGVGAAAVFMDARSSIERVRIDFDRSTVWELGYDHITPFLIGPHFDPIDSAVIYMNLSQPHDAGGD